MLTLYVPSVRKVLKIKFYPYNFALVWLSANGVLYGQERGVHNR